jgi:PEGA domain
VNEASPFAAVVLVVSLGLLLHSAPVSAGRAGTGGAGRGGVASGHGPSMGTGGTRSAPHIAGGRARLRRPCGARGGRCFGGWSNLDAIGLESESLLVVDATPGSAQVYLDGRPLGTAGELLARALPLAPGGHVVAIVAPAYRPWVARVEPDPPYSTRIRVALVPE